MHEPLRWNKLDEAAAWLTEATNEQWSVKQVLDAALTNCETREKELFGNPVSSLLVSKPRHLWITCLEAVMPWGTEFGHYESSTAEDSSEWVRKFSGAGNKVELTQGDVKQLLLYGQVRVKTARYPDLGTGDKCVLIEPVDKEHIVTLDMVGISRNDLKMLAKEFGMAKVNSSDQLTKEQSDEDEEQRLANPEKYKKEEQSYKRKYHSALLEILAMAMARYGHDPKAETNSSISQIERDFKKVTGKSGRGKGGSNQTIRERLKEASKIHDIYEFKEKS